MNIIKDITEKDLRVKCAEIIQHTFFEEDLVAWSATLAQDLQRDFHKLYIQDIKEAFDIGIRETDLFHFSVKTYYKWIKTHRDLIWKNESIQDEYKHKQLKYRTSSSGLKKIDHHIKYITK
jgi:hypothetical protein